jgi:hypothetical protein
LFDELFDLTLLISSPQIDVAAAFMGTVANIGQLVTNAQIPCGSIVSLIGETLGPMLFSCGPMAPALQLPVRMITVSESTRSLESFCFSPSVFLLSCLFLLYRATSTHLA